MARILPRRKLRLECGHLFDQKLVVILKAMPGTTVYCMTCLSFKHLQKDGDKLW
jgi:hypothetical protein